jgi:hypothetical protein
MPQYTYSFYNIRSQEKLGVLPLYGVNFTDLLVRGEGGASAGTFTGSIRMDNDLVTTQEILDITRPEATAVWVDRDNVPIWCGILWTRTYQSDGRVMQLNAQTFSSYLSKVVWDPANPEKPRLLYTDVPYNMIRYLWRYLIVDAAEEYDVGVRLSPYQASTDTPMTIDFLRSERKFLSEYLSLALKQGAEFRIVPRATSSTRYPLLECGVPGSLGVAQDGAVQSSPFQYPGDLSKYWLTNSALGAPTKLIGIGKTTGQSEIVSVQQGDTTGRIGVDAVVNYDTTDLTTLTRLATHDLTVAQSELNRPVYELGPANTEVNWSLGDYKYIVIDDPYRFPTPVGGYVRLVGWGLSPASSDGVEQQSITIDDASKLVELDD